MKDLTREICGLSLPKGKAFIEIMQNTAEVDNDRDRHTTYVCGLFISKTIPIPDVVSYVTNYMPVIPYLETFTEVKRLG